MAVGGEVAGFVVVGPVVVGPADADLVVPEHTGGRLDKAHRDTVAAVDTAEIPPHGGTPVAWARQDESRQQPIDRLPHGPDLRFQRRSRGRTFAWAGYLDCPIPGSARPNRAAPHRVGPGRCTYQSCSR